MKLNGDDRNSLKKNHRHLFMIFMIALQRKLDELLLKGAVLHLPNSRHFLFFATLDKAKSQIKLLYLHSTTLELVLENYSIVSIGFDDQTQKLYLAYSSKDYLQIRFTPLFELERQRNFLESHYLKLTNEVLPQIAIQNQWPIIENHCIQRVILDNITQDCWYLQLPKTNKPAYRQLNSRQLGSAVYLAISMSLNGHSFVQWLNHCSLSFRNK